MVNAGFRCEQQNVCSGYMDQNPPSYWTYVAQQMAAKWRYQQTGIWIVSKVSDSPTDRNTYLSFPSPGGIWNRIKFACSGTCTDISNAPACTVDKSEDYLTAFDNAGIKIYLQCEPSDASVSDLITLILNRYGNHSCVIGFGIDIEWYKYVDNPNGKKVTNAEAQSWINQIKAYNPNYKLFIKHWDATWLPTIHYPDVIYINDSQGHQCLQGCSDSIMDRYVDFANTFSDAKVGIQIGYNADKPWWSKYSDPAQTIGDAIISNIPNLEGIYWVDFTIKDIFPVGLNSILISPTTASIMIGTNKDLLSNCKDQNGDIIACPTLTWKSYNTSVASVDNSGIVTGLSVGTTNISASFENITSNISTITVVPLGSIQISLSLKIGATRQLIAKCFDSSKNLNKCPILLWKSSNPSVATVSNSGVVKGISAGSAVITASALGITSNTFIITVISQNYISSANTKLI